MDSLDGLVNAFSRVLSETVQLHFPVKAGDVTIDPRAHFGFINHKRRDRSSVRFLNGERIEEPDHFTDDGTRIKIYVGESEHGHGTANGTYLHVGNKPSVVEAKLRHFANDVFKVGVSNFLAGLAGSVLTTNPDLHRYEERDSITYSGNGAGLVNLEEVASRAVAILEKSGIEGEHTLRTVETSTEKITEVYVDTNGSSVVQQRLYVTVSYHIEGVDFQGKRYNVGKTFVFRNVDNLDRILERGTEKLKERYEGRKDPVELTTRPDYPVLFSGAATGTFFHEAIGAHLLSAAYIASGESTVFPPEMLGQQVLPEWVTIIDDPTLKNGHGSYSHDEEGIPAQKVTLVEEGVLRSYLMDMNSAAALSSETDQNFRSNGRARSEWISEGDRQCSSEPRVSNLVIDAGDYAESSSQVYSRFLEQIASSPAGYGVLIEDGGGEVDPGTGLFVHRPEAAWLVDSQGKKRLIRDATVVAQASELFSGVEAIGDHYGTGFGFCGADSGWVPTQHRGPELLFKAIKVVGAPKDTRTSMAEKYTS